MEFVTSSAQAGLNAALNSVGRHSRIVLCGELKEKEMLQEQIEYSQESISQIVEASSTVDARIWFRDRKKELVDEYTEEGFEVAEIEGTWPGPLNGHEISMHRDLMSGKLLEEVLLAKLVVDAPWRIPAHFKYGGWNDCPNPEVQCAVWQDWGKRYRAEIVSVSHDVIEAWVPRPPTDQNGAMSLAWEQFLYCGDIVDQGVETVANLAGTLVNSNSWYFWWD